MLSITELEKQLFEMQDLKYRDFHSRLMPGIDKETIIGIRTPILRKFTKEFARTPGAEEFLTQLPHRYYEENNMHMMIITSISDYKTCLAEIQRFLPYINNWATCDFPAPRCFAKHLGELLSEIQNWIVSGETYTVRYGIGMLMRFYLDDEYFSEDLLALAADIKSDEYYVNMMVAWYFATALAKQYGSAVRFINDKRLPVWTHNKAIQKAIESRRISPETKEYLRTQKIRGT